MTDDERDKLVSWARRRTSAAGLFVLPRFDPDQFLLDDLVERWFSELTTKKLQRSTHRSTRPLNADIRAWIDTWNENPRPYVWVKTADEILDSIGRYCQRINDSAH